jgi:hypothetical protein
MFTLCIEMQDLEERSCSPNVSEDTVLLDMYMAASLMKEQKLCNVVVPTVTISRRR